MPKKFATPRIHSPPRAGAAYRWEVAFLLHPQEPHAVVPARMAWCPPLPTPP